MYMRLVQVKIKHQEIQGFRKFYGEKIIPALKQLPGCLSVNLMRAKMDPDEFLSLTLWEQREHAEAYEQSGLFQELVEQARPYFSESSEWKLELSNDLKLEYKPATTEPIVNSYPVVAQTGEERTPVAGEDLMYLRIVSHKVQAGKSDEFRDIYRAEIIPALLKVEGCRYAYLIENLKKGNAFYSVTVWENHDAAEAYENSGMFEKLLKKLQPTFSQLFQWKMKLAKGGESRVVTSEDMKLDHYEFVMGQKFR